MNVVENSEFTNRIKNSIMKLSHNWDIKFLQADKRGAIVEIL